MPRLNERTRRDLRDGIVHGAMVAVIAAAIGLPVLRAVDRSAPQGPATTAEVPAAHAAPAPPAERRLDLNGLRVPTVVAKVAQWAVDDADNGSLPFAIVDKRGARLYVFEAGGTLLGQTPILLGYAAGDESVQGIGTRPIDDVRPEERTTPAGRFVARPGRNAAGEQVVWVDYVAAVSMHRVRATNPRERRLERLASPVASARRISFGCINVPEAFFEQVVWPTLGSHGAVVYVLPEIRSLEVFFPRAAAIA